MDHASCSCSCTGHKPTRLPALYVPRCRRGPGPQSWSQHRRGGEIFKTQLSQRRVGNDLEPVHAGEEDNRRADIQARLELLREKIYLDGRPAGMGDERGETGNSAPEAALGDIGPGYVGAAPGDPVVEGKQERDDANDQPNMRIGYISGCQPANGDARQGRGDQDFQIGQMVYPPVGPQGEYVHGDQDWQQDTGRLYR